MTTQAAATPEEIAIAPPRKVPLSSRVRDSKSESKRARPKTSRFSSVTIAQIVKTATIVRSNQRFDVSSR